MTRLRLIVAIPDVALTITVSLLCCASSQLFAQPQGRFVNVRPIIGEDVVARDSDPWVSPDGLRIYFASQRGNGGPNDITTTNLWMAERSSTEEPFGTPTMLPATINAAGLRDTSPFLFNNELSMIYDGVRPRLSNLENALLVTRTSTSAPWS